MRTLEILFAIGIAAVVLRAQPQKTEPAQPKQPQVRINYLNVCFLSDADHKELAAMLARIPVSARFGQDFEIDRGRASTPGEPASNWVRIRREFTSEAPFSNAQYTFSVNDDQSIAETLVLRARESKPGLPLEISFQDTVSAGTAAAVLASDTPAERIRMERFGGASIVLARCPAADQSVYEPLFRQASQVFARYRVALNVRQTVPGDLARISVRKNHNAVPKKKAEHGASKKEQYE